MEEERFENGCPDGARALGAEESCTVEEIEGVTSDAEAEGSESEESESEESESEGSESEGSESEGSESEESEAEASCGAQSEAGEQSDTVSADLAALRAAFPTLALTGEQIENRARYAALRAAGATPAEAFAATNTVALLEHARGQRTAGGAGKAHLVGIARKSGRAYAPVMSAGERRIAREFFGDAFSDRELDQLYAKVAGKP